MTVTVAGLGTAAGPVYKPEPEIVPTVALPPVTPFTCHVTAVLLVFCTVAENCCVPPVATAADKGAIVTLTGICVGAVDSPPQPEVSKTPTPATRSHMQDASTSIVFRL